MFGRWPSQGDRAPTMDPAKAGAVPRLHADCAARGAAGRSGCDQRIAANAGRKKAGMDRASAGTGAGLPDGQELSAERETDKWGGADSGGRSARW